ncbi:Site-specific recombinase, phage integrase family (fragment) [Desulfamplus magnetovallimortis]|uniref:Site-specific recombinase, phage integrase family n=1 Tax=Desulfamplus magnetovallimortis TaxID=1246637 RepID=A0A1W1HEX0_9BACT
MEPKDIVNLDVMRLQKKMSKTLSPQTVKHVLNLLTWIVNYGTKNNLCEGLTFHIKKPTVNNEVTEDLNPDQLNALLEAIEEDSNTDVANIMKLALYTGMRRTEIFKLQWHDINFKTGFITIRDPKGGVDQRIPINELAEEVLRSIHPKGSPYIFPGKDGGHRTTTGHAAQRIVKRAGLPKNFRPLHGLRHVYASMLASSGKVDMYVLQRLLTHKSPKMTQRYAHLRDEALKNGASQIDEIIGNSRIKDDLDNVINLR